MNLVGALQTSWKNDIFWAGPPTNVKKNLFDKSEYVSKTEYEQLVWKHYLLLLICNQRARTQSTKMMVVHISYFLSTLIIYAHTKLFIESMVVEECRSSTQQIVVVPVVESVVRTDMVTPVCMEGSSSHSCRSSTSTNSSCTSCWISSTNRYGNTCVYGRKLVTFIVASVEFLYHLLT
jgi:hypothetical protein